MTAEHILITAHYFITPGHRDRVIELLTELAAASRAETANISYHHFDDADNESHILVLEKYTAATGFAAHRDSPHFRRLAIGGIIPLLDRREVSVYHPAA